MKFTLEIELGNDEMRTYSDLRKSIQASFNGAVGGFDNDTNVYEDETGLIRDANGNTVGKWEVTVEGARTHLTRSE